jgi:hypothetical protein
MLKPSPLKHKEDGHAPLSEQAHTEAHAGQTFGEEFEHITQDEFEIGSTKNYGVEGSGYDDVEGNVVKNLTKKYGEKGFTFKEARIGTDAVEVISPDGTSTNINLNSSWNGFNKNPQAYQQLMAVLNSNVDPEKKKVFKKTGLNPNDDGNYDIDFQVNEDADGEFASYGKLATKKKAVKPDEALDIAADIEGELTKALISIDSKGQNSTYPGLENRSSKFNLDALTPDHERNIRESVFKEFNKNRDEKVSLGSFNAMWDNGLFTNTKDRISSDFQRINNAALMSGEEINKDFITSEETKRHNKLKGKYSDKQKYNSQITEEQENIKNYKSQIKELDPIKDKEKISALNLNIEQSNANIVDYGAQIDNLSKTTKYTPVGKDGIIAVKTEETDEELASSLYNYEGMSEERAKRIKDAADDQKLTTDQELAAIKLADPKLTDKEALKELWKLKTLKKQQQIKRIQNEFITIDPTEMFGLPTSKKDKEFMKFMRTAKENGLAGKDGKIKMSLYDFMTKFDQNHRDFDNWHNAGSGMISEEDLALIEETETTRDQNEGQMDAIYEMYFMNKDPGEMEKGSLAKTFAQAGVEAAGREWFGMSDREAQNMATLGDGPRNQIMMDKMNDVQYDLNEQIADGTIDGEPLVWTAGQIENMTRTFGEEVAEGVGNFVPMLVELGVISAASGGIGSATGITGLMGALNAGDKGRKGKMAYHALMAGWEEAKMQAIFDLPPTGGAMFYAGGALTRGIGFKGRFAWMDPVFQKVIKGGVIGATSAEAAHITEMAYDDLMGHADFRAKFDESFGDMDANLRRFAVNAIVFKLTGVTHLKKGDLKTTGQKYRAIAQFEKEKQKLLDNPEGTRKELGKNIEKGLGGEGLFFYEGKPEGYENLSLKQMEKFDAISEVQSSMQQQAIRETHNAKLDPKDKNFEANYDRMVAQPMNEAIRAVVPEYKGFKVRFTENRREFTTDDKGRDIGNEAEFRPETNEMIFDKNMYKPGKAIHEYTHAALRAYFDKNPSLETNFTKKMSEIFKDFDFTTKNGTKLGDAINEHYGRKTEKDGEKTGTDLRTKEGKRLKNEEFLAYMSEMLSDPAIYYQKVAPTIFKEAKQEITSIMEENFGYTPQIKTAGDFVRLLGRLGQDASRGLQFKNKASRLAELDKIDFLGIEYSVAREKRQNEALGSRNLELEKQALLKKPPTAENKKEIAKLDKNIEASKVNQKFTENYKNAKAEEGKLVEQRGELPEGFINPKKERAVAALKENNKGILVDYVNSSYKDVPGSDLTKSDFRKYVENNEFLKILDTYSRRAESLKDVPFNFYLASTLKGGSGFGGGRMGNILKALGINVDKNIETVSRDAEGFTEKEFADNSGGSFSRETPGGSMGIELAYKLPVTQKHIDAVNAKYIEYKPQIEGGELVFKNIKDVAPGLTREMFGKGVGENALSLAEHWLTAHTANPLSYNPITATSNRVPVSLLEKLYKEGKTLKSKDFGKDIEFMSPKGRKAADAGLVVQDKIDLPNPVKNSKANKNWYLEKFGIKDNRSNSEIQEYAQQRDILKEAGDVAGLKELAKSQIGEGKLDISGMTRNDKVTMMPKQMGVMGDGITAQLLAARHLDLNRDAAGKVLDKARGEVHKFRAGKPEGLASKNLEGKRFEDQIKVLDAVQTPEFKALLDRHLKSDKPEQAVSKALVDYFELNKDKKIGISNKDLKKIGEEIGQEFQFGKITPLKIASKAAKAIVLPNELSNIEAKYGVKGVNKIVELFNNEGDLLAGQVLSKMNMKYLTEKFGVGAYEAMMMRGEAGNSGWGAAGSGPKGSGTNVAIENLRKGDLTNKHIYGIFRSMQGNKAKRSEMDAYTALEQVYAEMGGRENLKQFDGKGSDSNMQGDSKGLFSRVTSAKGEFSKEKMLTEYRHGEQNKEVLKATVENIADLYTDGKIDARQVRQWVEMHAGSMQGLIKKGASLAVLPEGKMSDLQKRYGKEWVLEHTTPAKYVKARIYDYILSKKNPNAKQAMDLTIRDMHTTFIPKTLDTMVNKILQENLPSNHVPGMDPLFSRYYLANHVSNFGLTLKNHITGKEYKASGDLSVKEMQQANEALRQNNLNLFPKEFKALASKDINSKIHDKLRAIEEAARLGDKKKKEVKGMSTWDFDDTLATTKSGVRYKIPNPSGKPAPGKKVIFMAGGAGSGKGGVIKQLGLEKQGYKIINSDISLEWLKKNHGLPENMNDLTKEQQSELGKLQWEARQIASKKKMKYQGNGDGVVVDGTGGSLKVMEKQVQEFRDKGYDVQMVFTETSLETAVQRNANRSERSLREGIVRRNHESVQANKEGFKKLFGENFAEVKTDNLKQADAMPPELIKKMDAFTKGYIKARLNAEQFATEGAKLKEQGAEFDFSEFNVVTKGEQGPFFQKALNRAKKFGLKDQFVLTARPPEAAAAIYEFLKAQGLNIPLKNITGLGNSTGEAKAMWMLEKFSEGYNDMYFADDAMQNVKAVRKVLNKLDIKSKVQQALASKNLDLQFNEILESNTGIGAKKEYKRVTAKMEGVGKDKRELLPSSAADFELLTSYTFAGKGKKGEADMKFFEDNLATPFAKGVNNINRAKQATAEDYLALRKLMPGPRKLLSKKVPGTKFTHDAAIRVDRWTKAGHEVPGLSKKDFKILQDVMQSNPELMAYSEALGKISKQKEGWIKPTENWLVENITADLSNISNKVNRAKYLEQWVENKNSIFSEKNLNKIEALYGPKHRDALEDMLYRMETGSNRTTGTNKLTNQFMNWTNASVGSIMFLNMRSAALQTLSSVNYLNWKENNPLQAAKAFANQPQYWKDFSKLFNSDMLKQRRAGLKMNVNEAEIAAAVENSSNKAASALNYILKKGFLPTQMADSFAIASGGATFYRNRIKMYEKQGMDFKAAEKKAFTDFQEIAEKTQQSSRPDLISQQQASPLGRLILAFANTPMQYGRIVKKSRLDLINGRGDIKSNVSKIAFYGAIQGMMFSSLQSGMFSMLFDDDLPEDYVEKKTERGLNTMLDGALRGTGVTGAIASALKNGVKTFIEEDGKDWNADYDNVWIDLLNVSPPIGSKVSKLKSASQSYGFNKEVIPRMGADIENPGLYAGSKVVSALTNVPLDRLVNKVNNIKGALDVENETWQRISMMMGYSRWDMGMDKPEKVEVIKEEIKQEKKVIAKEKAVIKREENKKKKEKENEAVIEENKKKSKKDGICSAISKGGQRCKSKAVGGGMCTVHEKAEQNVMGVKSRCKKIKDGGKQCGMQTSSKSGFCYYHD